MTSRAEPVFFGPRSRPLFGWLHTAAPKSSHPSRHPPLGLVICKPLGYEAVCCHRSIKALAADAADNDIPVLRFDYDGTGDSAGDDLDPQRLSNWVQSIHSAVDTIKKMAGVQQVCLLGIRLGATLAALATAEFELAGLVEIAPVIDARTYLRELRALALAGAHSEPPAWAKTIPDLQEAAGFALTRETREELNKVDLMKRRLDVKHALVIDRDDLRGNEVWVEQLRAAGVQVRHERMTGYASMMLDSHEAVVPTAMLASVTAWLKQRRETLPPVPLHTDAGTMPMGRSAVFSVDSAGAPSRQVRETAVFLDHEEILFGIVSEPVNMPATPVPLVLLLNSGAVHHIGPNRLYVTLARSWAAAGAIVLRMDISGIGDSRTRPGESANQVYTPHALRDVATAIDFMRERHRISECHAIGLCSGAYHGFKAAVAGLPFNSVVAINPLTFSWRAGMPLAFPEYRIAADVMRYRKNAFQLASWAKLLKGRVNLLELGQVLVRRMIGVTANVALNVARRLHLPLSNDLGTELQKLSQQQTSMLFVFAQNEPGLDLLRGGGGIVVDRLQRRGSLRIETIESADHTFTPRWSRERLIEVLDAHIRQRSSLPG